MTTADRAFFGLVGVALVAVVGLGMAACAALGVLAFRAFEAITTGAVAELVAAIPAVVFAAPVGAGVVLGIRSLRSQLRATGRIAHHARVHGLPVSVALGSSAAESGLEGRIDLVESGEPFAFAYGLLEPRVMVSSALAHAAPPAELQAVLSHERYHVAHLDPLRIVCARTLSRLFFYFPVLRGLSLRYAAAREFAADRRAVERCGHRALAGALHRVVAGPSWPELDERPRWLRPSSSRRAWSSSRPIVSPRRPACPGVRWSRRSLPWSSSWALRSCRCCRCPTS